MVISNSGGARRLDRLATPGRYTCCFAGGCDLRSGADPARGRARGAPLPFGPFFGRFAGWIVLPGETISHASSTLAGLLMLVVGLTGGIGSGKTAVSDRLRGTAYRSSIPT